MARLPHLALLAFATACGGAAPRVATTRIDTLPNGVVRVDNVAPSAWSDTSGWRLVEERTIAPADGDPGELGRPDGLAMGDDGSIYVIQRKPTAIKVFDPQGRFVRDIGRDGEGPGEFRVGYIGVRGDTIALQDPSTQRLSVLRADGSLLGTHATLCCWATSYLEIDDAGRVAVPGSDDRGDGVKIRMRLDGHVVDTLHLPESPKPTVEWNAAWTANGRKWNMKIPGPLQPDMLHRYAANGTLVFGLTSEPTLIVSRTGRDTARIITFTVPTQPISPTQRDSIFRAHLAGMNWKPEWLVKGGIADVPATWPAWSEISTDRAGNIWIGVPGPGGRSTTARVFTPDGVLLGAVPLPAPSLLSGAWGRDRLAVLAEDENGHQIVRIYRLVKPGA